MIRFTLLCILAMLATACSTSRAPKVTPASFAHDTAIPPFNHIILAEAAKYPTDGTHKYWWPKKKDGFTYDGCSTDVFLGGKKVMSGEPEGRTYCCGLTLEVFANAYNDYVAHNSQFTSPVTAKNWKDFQSKWFVSEMLGDGPGDALEAYGLGRKIAPSEVQPGDFVQLWRHQRPKEKNPSGHSVIFLEWVRDKNGKIAGLCYWSTQIKTKGIHERVEYFGDKPGDVDRAHVHYSRANPQALYLKVETAGL